MVTYLKQNSSYVDSTENLRENNMRRSGDKRMRRRDRRSNRWGGGYNNIIWTQCSGIGYAGQMSFLAITFKLSENASNPTIRVTFSNKMCQLLI